MTGCQREFVMKPQAWTHYELTHGHLFRLVETEVDFEWECWSIPMKVANLHKFAAEKQKALEAQKELVKKHHEKLMSIKGN